MIMRKQAGFTLMEIMIAIALVAIMAVTMGPKVMEYFGRGKKGATKSQLAQIKDAIVTFNMDVGRNPSSKEGLASLRENSTNIPNYNGPYLTKDPVDSWGHEFVYFCPPEKYTKEYRIFEVYSYGGSLGEAEPEKNWIHDGE